MPIQREENKSFISVEMHAIKNGRTPAAGEAKQRWGGEHTYYAFLKDRKNVCEGYGEANSTRLPMTEEF